jgi:putative effector of murein hydrolase
MLRIHDCNPVVVCCLLSVALLLITLYLREIIKKRQEFKVSLDILELSEQISGCAAISFVSTLIAGILTRPACDILTREKGMAHGWCSQ